MSDQTNQDSELPEGEASLARPYAKAVFELAKSKGEFQQWADQLALMASVSGNQTMRDALDNPRLTRSDAADMFIRVLSAHYNQAIHISTQA